jgi:outer membrane protein TolC
MAYWELRQLGFGEKAARREASSRITQTRMKQVALMDQVAREIVEAHAQGQSRAQQIETSREAVSAAQDSFRRNWERIENGQGLPIEVLQSIQALTSAQKEYVRSIADYNVAQFTLHRSLGWPVDASVSQATQVNTE